MKQVNLILLVGIVIGLTSCSPNTVKRELLAPPVSKKFDLKGHLGQNKQNIDYSGKGLAPIPKLIESESFIIDPNKYKHEKLYSVSAINVPVSDLLYHLAVDAKKELDLSSSVTGLVTINAVRQSLDSILQRVSEQVGAVYKVTNGLIQVEKDVPYWHSYRVDYVNITKEFKDTISLKMAVGSVASGSGSSRGGSRNSSVGGVVVKSSSKYDVWESLHKNILVIATAEDDLGGVVDGNVVVVNREAGLISVKASRAKHFSVKKYIDSVVSRTTKQVLIEATVIEVELNDKYQAGVNWSAAGEAGNSIGDLSQDLLGANLSSNPTFSLNVVASKIFDFKLGIKMLQEFGDAKVLSSPKIMALNNQAAILKVVDNVVYFTIGVDIIAGTVTSNSLVTYTSTVHTVPVGFMMNMTPFISDTGDVTLKIRPTLSNIVGYVNDPNPALSQANVISRIPIIQEREMDSILKLRNNQTAILGGLIQDKHKNTRVGVPFLSSIPLLGDLFSYRTDEIKKSELIIFIRPVIIKNPDIYNGDLNHLKNFLKTQDI